MSPFEYNSGSEGQGSIMMVREEDETGRGWLESILEDLRDRTLAELEEHCKGPSVARRMGRLTPTRQQHFDGPGP